MKACNPDLSQQLRVVNAVGQRIAILTGEEGVFPSCRDGSRRRHAGGIDIFPRTWTRIFELASAGRIAEAKEASRLVAARDRHLVLEPNPGPSRPP